jgi:hypothetical protein
VIRCTYSDIYTEQEHVRSSNSYKCDLPRLEGAAGGEVNVVFGGEMGFEIEKGTDIVGAV